MFDVSWADPGNSETVGQRKQRKEQQQNSARNGSEQPIREALVRSSKSERSSASQFKPSFMSFFGQNYRKTVPKRGDPQLSPAKAPPSIIQTAPVEEAKKDRAMSSYTIDESTTQEVPPESLAGVLRADFVGSTYLSDSETNPSDITESIFSGRTERSRKTASTWSSAVESMVYSNDSHIVQSLSPKSSIVRSTEITVFPATSSGTAKEHANSVQISSTGTIPIQAFESADRSETPTATLDFPIPGSPISRELPVQPRSLSVSVDSVVPSKAWTIPSPSVWQSPEEWGIREQPSIASKPKSIELAPQPLRSRRTDTKIRRQKIPSAEMIRLQRNIFKMEAASDKIVLGRLKVEWTRIVDASVYRELELEKQLWMLTALRRRLGGKIQEITEPGTDKILSLFENQASCSSLSALEPSSQIHHLSTTPLSPISSWPNVHPLVVPGPSCQLPYASESFASIHAFALPALLPAASLPFMLEECHRTLLSKRTSRSKAGILHLTILDPTPLPSTLGPRLRDWLDKYLILHLERQFKCINPSRLFPVWLADAGLRAAGSTIFQVQFLACHTPFMVAGNQDNDESDPREISTEYNTKQELKSVVGRMMWKEMWGPYVQAGTWWWEDESVVEECERMQTCWEYSIIEAVKHS